MDTTCNHDQLNLVVGQLGQSFCRAEAGIADHDQIRHRARLDATFSLAQAQNLRRAAGHHGIDRVRIEAGLCVHESDLVEQVSGRGERRIAAQDHRVERTNKSK